jgi:hypothetical protein
MWMFLAYALRPDEVGVGVSRLFVDAAKNVGFFFALLLYCLLGYL